MWDLKDEKKNQFKILVIETIDDAKKLWISRSHIPPSLLHIVSQMWLFSLMCGW